MEWAQDHVFVSVLKLLRSNRPVHAPAPGLQRLPRLMMVSARRVPDKEEFPIIVHSLSPVGLAFRSPTRLDAGELLELKVLVQGSECLRLLGRVDWTLGSPAGGCSGEIVLQPCPVQIAHLQRHLALLQNSCRA